MTLTADRDSSFVCACLPDSSREKKLSDFQWKSMRAACAGEGFYRRLEGKDYCVFHFPGTAKREIFTEALQKKLHSEDFRFEGFWFPDRLDFEEKVFETSPNFDFAMFNGGVSFRGARFNQGAHFSESIFNVEADFLLAKFPQDAWFGHAEFNVYANFQAVTFEKEANFASAQFNDIAQFNQVKFNSKAEFLLAVFKLEADFTACVFNSEADFTHIKCAAVAHFTRSRFKAAARFHKCRFDHDVHFSEVVFDSSVHFNVVDFGGFVRFSGSENNKVFSLSSIVDLKFARMEKPDRVLFSGVQLRPYWFLEVDPSKFNFVNVEWPGLRDKKLGIADEIRLTKEKGTTPPHSLLSLACRQLATNAEESHRYEQASKFRYWAMDVRRRQNWRGAIWRLDWWYWFASGYGERYRRAFVVLMGIVLVFGLSYFALSSEQWTPKEIGNDAASTGGSWEEPADRVRPFKDGVRGALIYSLNVMTLQKPDDPRPAKLLARTLVTLETIMGPLQIALLALAIRRQFMK